MGWGHCGKNGTTGEEMGYSVEGTCHQEGCSTPIDHGLSYVCGGMHEGGENGCGYYFCSRHLYSATLPTSDGEDEFTFLCKNCLEEAQKI